MESIALMLLTVVLGLSAYGSVRFLARHPLNVLAAAVALCVFFYLLPAVAWMHGWQEPFEYGFSTAGAEVELGGELAPLALACGMTVLLLLGGMHGAAFGPSRISLPAHNSLQRTEPWTERTPLRRDGPGMNVKNLSRCDGLIVLTLVWIGLVLHVHHQSGLTYLELILPFRKVKSEVYGSFYVLYLAIYAPLTIGTVLYLKNNRAGLFGSACFLMAALAALGTGQRRSVLVVCLFLLALRFTRPALPVRGDNGGRNPNRVLRKLAGVRLAVAAAVCLFLGPLLWWARNWFSGLIDPFAELVLPWERQGFLSLLFGSSGAGFPTLLLVREWVATDGVQWGVSLLATLSVFIPRQLWPGKPAGAEVLLQEHFDMPTMPSLFLLNELYLNAGLLALPLAWFVGWALSAVSSACLCSNLAVARVVAVSMFANLITLFKNGVGPFGINVVFLSGLCSLAMVQEFRRLRFSLRGLPAGQDRGPLPATSRRCL
jgi:hypothetical protein